MKHLVRKVAGKNISILKKINPSAHYCEKKEGIKKNERKEVLIF